MDKNKKQTIVDKVEKAFLNTVNKALNEDKSTKRIEKLFSNYAGMPKDILAGILIKSAVRKTTLEGLASASGISGLELVLSAPVPEPSHKAAAIAGIAGLLATDVTATTAIQMQLALDLSMLYECPFYKNNEEDVWEIFRLAIGLKGRERAGSRVQFIFTEGAKKNFRKLLKSKQLRKRVQDWAMKKFGEKVAKLLSEKYLMRLIPFANIGIATYSNNKITKAVGKWAKVKSKIRSSCFNKIDLIKSQGGNYYKWILPVIFYLGTANDTITTNFISLYSQSLKRLQLTKNEENEIIEMIDNENIAEQLKEFCTNCSNNETKKHLFDIALSSVSINLESSKVDEEILKEFSKWLNIDYSKSMLIEKTKYLKK